MMRAMCVAAAALIMGGCASVQSASRSIGSADRAFSRVIDWEFGEEPQYFNIWYGEGSAVQESGYIIARNQNQWSQAWALTDANVRPGLRRLNVSPRDYVGPPIVLHPETHTGVALYAGAKDGGGSQIVIESVNMKKGVLTVQARTTAPGPDPRFPEGVNTRPYAILRIDAAPQEVVINFASAERDQEFGAFTDPAVDPFGGAATGGGDPFAVGPGGAPGNGDPFGGAPASDDFDPFTGGGDDPFGNAEPAPPAEEPLVGASSGSGPRQLASPDGNGEADEN